MLYLYDGNYNTNMLIINSNISQFDQQEYYGDYSNYFYPNMIDSIYKMHNLNTAELEEFSDCKGDINLVYENDENISI